MRRAILAGLMLLAALPASAAAEVSLQKVGDFVSPVQALGAPGDGQRLYVVEQGGRVTVMTNGDGKPFLDLRDQVELFSEQGLLSMAFAPDFQASRKLYVYYTQKGGAANRVDEFVAPTGDAVDPASQRLVISIPHPDAPNHNGGQLQFGPDGMLYLAPGDGGTGGAAARDMSSLLGKVLRIDPRGDTPGQYTVPADNPFVGQAGTRPEIWASGLRNPFRFTFDRLTGDLVLGDVGQETTEEINFLPNATGRGRGADFGWNECEGSFVTGSADQPCDLPGSVLPVINKFQSQGYHSIIPGYVVRDPSLPSLVGRLVYGDYSVRRLSTAVLSASGVTNDREIGPQVEIPQLSGFGEDAGGCIYATSGTSGAVYRLVENDARIPCGPRPPEAIPISAPHGADKRKPTLETRVKKRQRVLKLKGAVAYVRCDERCTVRAGGKLRIGKRRYALRSVTTRQLRAARLVRVKPLLKRRGVHALRRALDNDVRATVRIGLRARDLAGNRSKLVRRTVIVQR